MTDQHRRVAIVTGGNKGIGFQICKELAAAGLQVILTARSRELGKAATEKLNAQRLGVSFCRLDVDQAESIEQAARFAEREFGRIDVLVNNAGISLDAGKQLLEVDIEAIESTLQTNFYGPLLMSRAVAPSMRRNKYGRIVNVSSDLGSMNSMGGGYPSYRISKAALNALTKVMASELSGTNIKVNSMTPGWVRTDMGGAGAPRSVEQGAETAVWLATLADDGPSGGYFRDRKPTHW
ncbi:MAG TPA: SDR family oxidoreductase [Candidatus Binataceae bacterium]|jgi:NAD(P)-dependent dehydrogenase (short-subunit alcohol dehydrogenase family)